MNILHISDIHFRRSYRSCEEGYQGMLAAMQSPLIPLSYCIKRVQAEEQIDLLVISGDLTEDGESEDYAALKKAIEELVGDTKVIVTLGNHDHKEHFRSGWLQCQPSTEPYNQIDDLGSLAIISFDSSVIGDPNGQITTEQLQWLRAAFTKVKNKPVILLTHHHLLNHQSTMPCVKEANQLFEVIDNNPVVAILNGHTHHHYQGRVSGYPYFTADSMSFCGEDLQNGAVRFEEKYGYCFYQIESGIIVRQKSETFSNGRILKTIQMAAH